MKGKKMPTKSNFECLLKVDEKTCGEIFASKIALSAHFHHCMKEHHGRREKGFKITNDMWGMTWKHPTKKSTYNPAWNNKNRGKKKDEELVGVGPEVRTKRKYTRRQPVVTTRTVSGTITVPVNLEIEFTFGLPHLNQAIAEPQTIKIGGRKK